MSLSKWDLSGGGEQFLGLAKRVCEEKSVNTNLL